ncbi:hypothetical protein Lsan_2498, partial [Legionella santicrucis]
GSSSRMDGGSFFRVPQLYLATSCRTGVSPRCIISYLHRWCMWWVRTAAHWLYLDLLLWFLDSCWDEHVAVNTARPLHRHAANSVTSEQLGGDTPSPLVLQGMVRD